MAHNLKISNAAAQDMVTAFLTAAAGGTIGIFPTPQPANADAAEGVTALATLTLGTPAFTASNNVLTSLAITDDSNAAGGGDAVWFRIYSSAGAKLMDGSAGLAGTTPDLVMASATVTAGDTVHIALGGLTITLPKA